MRATWGNATGQHLYPKLGTELERDLEAEKRKARAARFGIPLVEPKQLPQQQQKGGKKVANGKAAKASAGDVRCAFVRIIAVSVDVLFPSCSGPGEGRCSCRAVRHPGIVCADECQQQEALYSLHGNGGRGGA